MARKKTPEALTRDSYFQSSLQGARERFGSNKSYVASDHEKKEFGIPLDNLMLMWLIDSNCWPLSRMTMSHGNEESGKSAFLYWLSRQFVKFDGTGIVVSTENKDSGSLLESILGEYINWVRMEQADTVQDMQERITYEVLHYIEKMDAHRSVPVLIGIDSLHGVQEAGVKEDIDKQGFAEPRGYPTAAASNTKYFQARMGDLISRPITIHCVNHVKQKLDAVAFGTNKRPAGAKHFRFQTALDIWFERGKTEPNGRGFDIHLECHKNSRGDSRRRAKTYLHWVPDKEHPGGQRTWFNWDKATVTLLTGFQKSKKPGEKDSAVFDVLSGFKQSGAYYSCAGLGMTNVRADELGRAINGDEKILMECVEALSIHKIRTFVAGEMVEQ